VAESSHKIARLLGITMDSRFGTMPSSALCSAATQAHSQRKGGLFAIVYEERVFLSALFSFPLTEYCPFRVRTPISLTSQPAKIFKSVGAGFERLGKKGNESTGMHKLMTIVPIDAGGLFKEHL
jgi:hypothetical protein